MPGTDTFDKEDIRKLLGWTRERIGHKNKDPFVVGPSVLDEGPQKTNRRQAIEAQKARGRNSART